MKIQVRDETSVAGAIAVRVAVVLSLGLGLALALGAGAASAEEDGLEGWTPAFRIGVGVHNQGLDGNVLGTDALPDLQAPPGVPDDPNTPGDESIDVSTPGSPGDSATTIAFRFAVRLYTPEDLISINDDYHPRFFVQVGAEAPLDDGFVAARYDNNFDIGVGNELGRAVSDFCPNAQASTACTYSARTTVDLIANWNIGFGVDFPLPFLEEQFHLVPFVEYFGQAYESQSFFSQSISETSVSDVSTVISGNSATEILHGISAGLGFEIDVFEGERVSARLFMESRVAFILSDRESNYSGINPVVTANFNTADFVFRPSTTAVTTAWGVELRWNGL